MLFWLSERIQHIKLYLDPLLTFAWLHSDICGAVRWQTDDICRIHERDF